ncbi:MAG: hypothetical protein ACNYPG_01825 [Candidatus Porifericomitaceae bacterium WSBS_2022_MAG_OTU9]
MSSLNHGTYQVSCISKIRTALEKAKKNCWCGIAGFYSWLEAELNKGNRVGDKQVTGQKIYGEGHVPRDEIHYLLNRKEKIRDKDVSQIWVYREQPALHGEQREGGQVIFPSMIGFRIVKLLCTVNRPHCQYLERHIPKWARS